MKGGKMSQRLVYILSFFAVGAVLGTGFYVEFVLGIMPCPLCTLQRLCFAGCGLAFLAGIYLLRFKLARIIINLTSSIFAILGMLLAGRQIWIQYFPSGDTSACGVSINYMLTVLPIKDVAQKIFSGSAECSQRGLEFLGLNMPEWSLLCFAAFLLVGVYYLFRECLIQR
jgi:disulfide bond formation protein DsbB